MRKSLLRFLLAATFLVTLFMSFCGLTYNYFDGEYYIAAKSSDGKLMAFAEDENNSYLIHGGTLYVYSRETNETVTELSLNRTNGKFIFSPDLTKLYIFSSYAGSIRCEIWSIRKESLIDTQVIDSSYLSLQYLTVDARENVWFVCQNNLRRLNLYSLKTGMLYDYSFETKIKSICTFDTLNIAYTGNSIIEVRAGTNGIEESELCKTGNMPCQLVSFNAYISAAGELCSLSDGTEISSSMTIPDIQASMGITHSYFCADNYGGVYGVSASSTAAHLDSDGNIDCRYAADGTVTAAGPYSLIVYKSGQGFYISAYDSFTVRSTSGEEEKTIPESWNVSGGYIIFSSGTGVSSVIDESGALIYDGDSEQTSGVVKTGMTLVLGENHYVISVMGDINRNGASNTKDFQLMEQHAVGETLLEGDCFVAADMNEDGVVNTADLVLFRNAFLTS